MYDPVTLGRKGINWAANFDNYNWILNDESKEERGWRTPFEIYYGRKTGESVTGLDSEGDEIKTRTGRVKEVR